MKRIAFIFILLSCFVFNHIKAESISVFPEPSPSAFSSSGKDFMQSLSDAGLSKIDAGDSGNNPFSKAKKRFKRGLFPVIICPTNEFALIVIVFEIELVFSPASFYFFHPDFVHGERGPPSSL